MPLPFCILVSHSFVAFGLLITDGSLLVTGKMCWVDMFPASIALYCFFPVFRIEEDRKAPGSSIFVEKLKRLSSWF